MVDNRPQADRILVARLSGAVGRLSRWGVLDDAQADAGVAELRELAGGRGDLLAEVAGLSVGTAESKGPEYVAQGEAIARLCRAAGADQEAIGEWTEEGRRRAAAGRPALRLKQGPSPTRAGHGAASDSHSACTFAAFAASSHRERGAGAAQGRETVSQPQPPWNPEDQQGQQPPQDPRQPPPGWYPDPGGMQMLRWWDGMQWGPHTQPLPGAGQEPQRPDPGRSEDAATSPGPAAGPSPASVPQAQSPPPDPLQPQGWPQQSYGQDPRGPQPPPPGPLYGQGPRQPWTGRGKAWAGIGIGAGVLLALIIAIGAAGGNSSGSSAAGSAPSASALAAQPSSDAGQPSSNAGEPSSAAGSPSSAACTSRSCIVQEMEQSLTGLVAQDESVATKVVCYKSTVVFHQAADTYSASCTVTYSGGSQASGTGNLDLSQDQATFTPSGV